MQQDKYDIFISYRRKDENGKEWGTAVARNILQALEDRGYKGRVFFDHNKIGPEDFEKKILGAIKQAKVFLCVLTKNAMDNCINEGDWVRREICQAIESGLKIIFLNPDNEFNHKLLPKGFPNDLEIVKTQNSLEVRSGQKFEVDIDDIVNNYIRTIVPCQSLLLSKSPTFASMGTLRIKTDLDCRVFNYGEEVGVVKVGEYEKLLLPVGENLLKFVSQECEEVYCEQKIKVEKDFQQLVDVKLVNIYKTYNAKKEKERQIYLLNLPDYDFGWFEEDGKYGFKLVSTDEVIVPSIYDDILIKNDISNEEESYSHIPLSRESWRDYLQRRNSNFTGGLAAVKKGNVWGYIDKIGKIVIPLKYDRVWRFSNEGWACVKLNGKHGFINKEGKEIIPLKYDGVKLPWMWNSLPVKIGEKWGLINDKGVLITPIKYDEIVWNFKITQDSVRVRIWNNYGWVNFQGKEVVAPKFDYFVSEEILTRGWKYRLEYTLFRTKIAIIDFFKSEVFGLILLLVAFGLIVIAVYTNSTSYRLLWEMLAIIMGCVGLSIVVCKNM